LGLQTIHITHQHYLALSYPLAFPLGEQSWNVGMRMGSADECKDDSLSVIETARVTAAAACAALSTVEKAVKWSELASDAFWAKGTDEAQAVLDAALFAVATERDRYQICLAAAAAAAAQATACGLDLSSFDLEASRAIADLTLAKKDLLTSTGELEMQCALLSDACDSGDPDICKQAASVAVVTVVEKTPMTILLGVVEAANKSVRMFVNAVRSQSVTDVKEADEAAQQECDDAAAKKTIATTTCAAVDAMTAYLPIVDAHMSAFRASIDLLADSVASLRVKHAAVSVSPDIDVDLSLLSDIRHHVHGQLHVVKTAHTALIAAVVKVVDSLSFVINLRDKSAPVSSRLARITPAMHSCYRLMTRAGRAGTRLHRLRRLFHPAAGG
jgi:hypothetical protein